jgi:hypothetical protein
MSGDGAVFDSAAHFRLACGLLRQGRAARGEVSISIIVIIVFTTIINIINIIIIIIVTNIITIITITIIKTSPSPVSSLSPLLNIQALVALTACKNWAVKVLGLRAGEQDPTLLDYLLDASLELGAPVLLPTTLAYRRPESPTPQLQPPPPPHPSPAKKKRGIVY